MLKEFDQDTIVAISTPAGEGGIGIVRLSGKEAVEITDKIFKPKNGKSFLSQKSFTASYGHIEVCQKDGSKKIVDEVLVLVMRAPKSYTCENVVEISAHGGAAVLQSILGLCVENGARLAAKGEFTKRAFLNGRIDLLQAEAVLDLVKAKAPASLMWATQQLDGALSQKMKMMKEGLLNVLSHLEAAVDFPDDLPETDSPATIEKKLAGLGSETKMLLSSAALGMIAKTGIKLVIAGRPNVGKSSLMNQLTKKNRVIVTPFAGTTRDVVEDEVQIGGFPVRLFDTAGIQETLHPIEKEGIERSKLAVSEADLVLYVLDGSEPPHPEDRALLTAIEHEKRIIVINKTDLPLKLDIAKLKREFPGAVFTSISCVNSEGLNELEDKISRLILNGKTGASYETVLTSIRQKDLLEKVLKNIEDARQACANDLSPELITVDVRLALDHLGELVGEVINDDMLEMLFNQFCIGK